MSSTAPTIANLGTQLEELAAGFAGNAPADVTASFGQAIEQLATSGILEQSLKAGESAPDFTLPNATGGEVHLADLLARGPVVLTFYRGEWCPWCNLTLRAYQAALPEFQRYGAQLVAISPQTPDNSLASATNKELTYPVLSDAGNSVARQYRLVYKFSDELKEATLKLGVDLQQFNGDDRWELPLAGTFVIGQDGKVKNAFVDASFMKRMEPSAILETLQQL
ncbi:MAG: AhpC/TSA family protein [Caldilineaceae bacterium]|nr:AhpC/TSA family protein [Caldilineaceae bacterium]